MPLKRGMCVQDLGFFPICTNGYAKNKQNFPGGNLHPGGNTSTTYSMVSSDKNKLVMTMQQTSFFTLNNKAAPRLH